jgi:hypothetical protein
MVQIVEKSDGWLSLAILILQRSEDALHLPSSFYHFLCMESCHINDAEEYQVASRSALQVAALISVWNNCMNAGRSVQLLKDYF